MSTPPAEGSIRHRDELNSWRWPARRGSGRAARHEVNRLASRHRACRTRLPIRIRAGNPQVIPDSARQPGVRGESPWLCGRRAWGAESESRTSEPHESTGTGAC